MLQLFLAILLLFGGGHLPIRLPDSIVSLAMRQSPSSAGYAADGSALFQVEGLPDVTWNDRLADGTLILTHVRGKGTCASPTYEDLALAAGTRVRTLIVAMKNTNGRVSAFVLRRSGRAWPVVMRAKYETTLAAAMKYVGRGLVCEGRSEAWERLARDLGFTYDLQWLQ